MAQLNVHVPASSDLLARVEAAAEQLGTTPSALARVVLEVALEPYVQAQLELRRQEQAYSSRVVASLRSRFSGALPARPFAMPEAAGDDATVSHETGSEVAEGVGREAGRAIASASPTGSALNGGGRTARPAAATRAASAVHE